MSWDNIHVEDYGQWHTLILIDRNGQPADVSGYTAAQQMELFPPTGLPISVAATFDTDGSDGVVKYMRGQGIINRRGAWEVRVVLMSETARLTSDRYRFRVIE